MSMTIKDINRLLDKYNITLTKSLGQNFLIDNNIKRKIIDSSKITKSDNVIEIGPGVGVLSLEIAKKAKKLVTVEIDNRLIPALEEVLGEYDNTEIINVDALDLDIENLTKEKFNEQSYKVIANLPYYVTSPIIMKFIESDSNLDTLILMMQKEVANRIIAKPYTKEYGILSIAVQIYCDVERVCDVPKTVFLPMPKVQSTVLKFIKNDKHSKNIIDKKLFFRVVKAAFGNRRKTILNSLSSNLNISKDILVEKLSSVDINDSRRAETLDIHEYIKLSNALSDT